ncbi:MAG TPA: Holliday junction branch migration protein RuvA [Rhabdochlamydiaceae bacterium]|nr:Holliday junction branch migration protein RuvA [Rhabdochlamydiaceae bacterium]
MFEYIKGKLTDASPLKAVIEINGLGYSLLIPVNNYSKLPAFGHEILLYVSTVIREDSHKVYGFLTRTERDLFENLIEVSGIGPKTGLALIGHMEIDELQLAIAQSNIALICKIPGIGKKTAERLVVEMRDKFQKMSIKGPLLASKAAGKGEPDLFSDALSALVNLGYHPLKVQKAINNVLSTSDGTPELAKVITAALRCI